MKLTSKIISLLLVAILVLSLSVSVFADANAQHTITVVNDDAQESHTYVAYQVFAGDYDYRTGTLSNVSWGSGVDSAALLADLNANVPDFASCINAGQVVQVVAQYASNSEALRTFASYVDKHKTNSCGSASGDASSNAVINVTGDGYYYVKDETASLALDTYSDYILQVEGDVTINAKDTTGVRSQKKVQDINDSNQVGSGWQDSADYDIGDPVPFQFKATVADDYDNYNSYKLTFHDNQSSGLTFDHITAVYVDDTAITGGYEVVTSSLSDDCTFEVRFADLKAIDEVHGGSVITVEYISVLNENAVIGEPGNPNEMRISYSNNPTDETSVGFTPWDKVVVFTYEVIIDKVDENGEPLDGAMFKLEKWIPNDGVVVADLTDEQYGSDEYGHWLELDVIVGDSGNSNSGPIIRINGKNVRDYEAPDGTLYYVILDKPNEQAAETDIYLKASEVEAVASTVSAGTALGIPYYELIDGNITQVAGNFSYTIRNLERQVSYGTQFIWKGVDDGHYRITETVTPPGFNTLDPIVFEIIASHEEESEDPVLLDVDGDPFMPTQANMGILQATVINRSGAPLPETGGMGTTLFYVLGALLILGVGVVLVVKKYSDA